MKQELEKFGFSDKEARVYLSLLGTGNSNVALLSKKTGINRVTVYPVLEKLRKKGLVSRMKKRGKLVYYIEDPRLLKEKIDHQAEHITKLMPDLLALYRTDSFKPGIKLFEGKDGMRTLFFDSLHENKKKEVLFVYPAWDIMDIFGRETVQEYVEKRVSLGISVKAIRQKEKEVSIKDHPFLGSSKELLREVRVAPGGASFSVVNAVYDDSIAFFASKKENFGLLINSPSLAQLMRTYFMQLWHNADPL